MSQFKEYTNIYEGNGSTRIVINVSKIVSIWEVKNEKDEMVTCIFGEGQTWTVKESFAEVTDDLTGKNWMKKFGLNPNEPKE